MSSAEAETPRSGRRRLSLDRSASKIVRVAIDLSALASAYLIAFLIRFDGSPAWPFWKMAWLTLPYVVFAKYALLTAFGVPQFAWRYIGLDEAIRILRALAIGSLLLLCMRLLAPSALSLHLGFTYLVVPLGVIAIDAALAPILVIGVRTLRRAMVERSERDRRAEVPRVSMRTLLVGAGDEGASLARTLEQHPELGVEVVGLVDDEDGAKVGSRIRGFRVLGTVSDVPSLVRRHDIEQAILALPDHSRDRMREALGAFDGASIPVKILPSVASLVGVNGARLSLRPVALEDLLRRGSVTLEDEPVESLVRGCVVLVTGAGGSIGSELARQLASYGPRELLLAERSEHALYEIERELRDSKARRVVPRLLDVTNKQLVEALFETHRPTVVFHAAAHKHVPLLEDQVAETVRNNVLGTAHVVDAACGTGAKVVVLVSTDKAVNPSSVMGASKRAAEIFLQQRARDAGKTRLTAVRFGNVLGSSGSVVPLFRSQIAAGGPITITHPEMRRYFMTIPEASQLVLHAATIGGGGEILILDMGEPVRIVDLAEDLIRLSGLVPHRDIRIEFSGTRPGEKLFEELSVDSERALRTMHPKIFTAKIRDGAAEVEAASFEALFEAARANDEGQTRKLLEALVPEYKRPELV